VTVVQGAGAVPFAVDAALSCCEHSGIAVSERSRGSVPETLYCFAFVITGGRLALQDRSGLTGGPLDTWGGLISALRAARIPASRCGGEGSPERRQCSAGGWFIYTRRCCWHALLLAERHNLLGTFPGLGGGVDLCSALVGAGGPSGIVRRK